MRKISQVFSSRPTLSKINYQKLIENSGIFDPEWYLENNPDVASAGLNPFLHFVDHGENERRSPNPYFDVSWYLDTYRDVAESGMPPLLHFLRHGAAEFRDPHPMFSTRFYLENTPSSAKADVNPLAHFMARWKGERYQETRSAVMRRRGADRAFDPHPLFDSRWFIARYADALAGDVNPLAHFLKNRNALDLDPHPLIDTKWCRRAYPALPRGRCVLEAYLHSTPGEMIRHPSAMFDRQWYLDTYARDMATDLDPLLDYVLTGQKRGRLPHPIFAEDWYVRQNPDARAFPGGAVAHFRHANANGGLSPSPLFDPKFYTSRYPDAAKDALGPLAHFLLSRWDDFHQPHPLFDPRWYAACNPELSQKRINALSHLMGWGVWSHRDPSPLFDTAWYLEQYPRARKNFVHPITHYLETGCEEGCWPTPFFDPSFYAETYPDCAGMDPLIHFATIGMPLGHATNEWQGLPWSGTPEPDVFGASTQRLSRYVHEIGLTSRLVLACDAVKQDKKAYDHYFWCLTANASRWQLPEARSERPVISVILPVYNGLHFTMACIESIGRFLPDVPFELIVADNCSTDETERVLSARSDIRYIRHPENLGFLRSCNRAARFARGDFVFLLNNDTLVAPGWLDELYKSFALHPNVGLVGSKLIYPDGRLQEAGGIIWADGSAWNYGKFKSPDSPEFNYVRETDYVSGAAIMLPRRLWDELGGFDEMYVPSYCEDSDLALRVRALGYSVLYSPLSVISHFEGMTQGRDTSSGIKSFQISNTEKLRGRWKDYLATLQPNGVDVDKAKDRGFTRRALFLDNCTPAPKEDAGSLTALNLMILLRSRGYQVTFIPRDNYLYVGETTKALQRLGIEVLYGPFVTSVDDHLAAHGGRYDLVFIMRPDSYERHIEAIRKHAKRAKLVYHACDLHYLRFEREAEVTGEAARKQLAAKYKKIEFEAFRSCDASIVHSTAEANIIRAEAPELLNINVFGWAIPVSGSRTPWQDRHGAIFVGGFNHAPNVDAVMFFVKDILPIVWKSLPDFTFHVVGSKVPDELRRLASDRVKVHGFVDDIDPLMQSCRMAVAPLRYGAGIKGKIATAMSTGLPNIVTTIGAEGMGLVDGSDCLIADSAEDFANAVIQLNENLETWRRISHNSRKFAETTYGPTAASAIFDRILAGLRLSVPGPLPAPALCDPTGRESPYHWPGELNPVISASTKEEWAIAQNAEAMRRVRLRNRAARLVLHDRPELGFPGYSCPAKKYVKFLTPDVEMPPSMQSLGQNLICPETGLNNRDRLALTLAEQHRGGADSRDQAGIITTSPLLLEWAKKRGFQIGKFDGLVLALVDAQTLMDSRLALRLAEDLVEGGVLLSLEADFQSAMLTASRLISTGFSSATVCLYHAPDYGHLGDDLIVVHAAR